MEEKSIMCIASEIQANAKAEAQAIVDYTMLLKNVVQSEILDETRDIIIENIKEIIADELNHQKLLEMLYTKLTQIEPNIN